MITCFQNCYILNVRFNCASLIIVAIGMTIADNIIEIHRINKFCPLETCAWKKILCRKIHTTSKKNLRIFDAEYRSLPPTL